MRTRAEVAGWKQLRKPRMCLERVSVAIVVGARESRVHGKGPQLVRCVKVLLRSCIPGNPGWGWKGNDGKGPGRRSPCAVKVARTVATGGMERRVVRYRALSLPTLTHPILCG